MQKKIQYLFVYSWFFESSAYLPFTTASVCCMFEVWHTQDALGLIYFAIRLFAISTDNRANKKRNHKQRRSAKLKSCGVEHCLCCSLSSTLLFFRRLALRTQKRKEKSFILSHHGFHRVGGIVERIRILLVALMRSISCLKLWIHAYIINAICDAKTHRPRRERQTIISDKAMHTHTHIGIKVIAHSKRTNRKRDVNAYGQHMVYTLPQYILYVDTRSTDSRWQ